MTSTPIEQQANSDWMERVLSTGVKLCVEKLVTLRIGNGDSFMFTVPVQEVRQVTVGLRTSDAEAQAYPRKDYPWNVDVAYQSSHFAFICSGADLSAVRYVFDGIPIVDMAARLGLPPAF
jgi:hypothetical protein